MGAETTCSLYDTRPFLFECVKLNNPQMGAETIDIKTALANAKKLQG